MYSLALPWWSDSNKHTQHSIILFKIENISINYRHLLPDLAPWLNLIGSNYPSPEKISIVPKMFEPLKFDSKWTHGNHKRRTAKERAVSWHRVHLYKAFFVKHLSPLHFLCTHCLQPLQKILLLPTPVRSSCTFIQETVMPCHQYQHLFQRISRSDLYQHLIYT